jgi:hypothetical protein
MRFTRLQIDEIRMPLRLAFDHALARRKEAR